jgi:hypothetical protein
VVIGVGRMAGLVNDAGSGEPPPLL